MARDGGENLLETKRWLKQRIFSLEKELEIEQRKNQLPEESGLAKCKGVICKACVHAVSIEDYYGNNLIIGCDISTNCENFSRRKG